MDFNFWTTLIGAVVGAAVGGLISFLIQLKVLRENSKQRAAEIEERRKALGHSLIFKLIKICSVLTRFHDHLLESENNKENKKKKLKEPWQRVTPIVNVPDFVHFSTEEMAMLLSLGDDDLFNDLIPYDRIHNSAIHVFEIYNRLRDELSEALPTKFDGLIGESRISKEQMMLVRAKMIQANQLIESIKISLDADVPKAWEILEKLNTLLKDKLELKITHQSSSENKPT